MLNVTNSGFSYNYNNLDLATHSSNFLMMEIVDIIINGSLCFQNHRYCVFGPRVVVIISYSSSCQPDVYF